MNITFGAGPNPGPPLAGATTNYQFVATDCPNDGYYAVRNQTSDCFGFTWFSLYADHTGDPNGYFMLVNASYQPSDFYVSTVNGLCPGTVFQFAAWIINMNLPHICNDTAIKPNLTFRIETTTGDLLGSYNSGDIPSTFMPVWKEYGFFFQTPPGVSSVVIRMTNNAPGGCGNDLALDDITFRPCGPDIGVSINGQPGDTANICYGKNNSYLLNSMIASGGYANPAYQWQLSTDNGTTWADINNATDSIYSRPQSPAGNYLYRVTAAERDNINNPICRVDSKVIGIYVNPLPQINLQNNAIVCGNDSIILTVNGAQTYNWTGPDNFTSADSTIDIPNPPISYSGEYYVTATTAKGCTSSDSTNIFVYPAAFANAGSDVTICEGTSTELTGAGGVSYSWSPTTGLSSPASSTTSASPSDTTAYILTITDSNGCKANDTVNVNILKKPVADAGPDKTIFEGQPVTLTATAAGTSVYYSWSPMYNINDPSLLQPTVSPAQDTTYTLTVSSSVGCGTATDQVFVRVFQKVIIPNAFSPNGDGINDTWNIQKLDTYPEADLYVYNRFGQAVFHSKGYNKPWDGTINGKHLPLGTYYYLIDLKNGLPKLSGWVVILY